MKKSTKKSLTALVAVPVAAALLAGCSFGADVPSAIDDNPYSMPPRTYSTETEISDSIAFAGGIEVPDLTNSPDAYISSVSNYTDGSTIIIIENVAYEDYFMYSQEVMGGEEEPVSSGTDAEYYVAYDETAEVSTMGIIYSSGAVAAVPTEFKFLDAVSSVSENLYIKYTLDPAEIYNKMIEGILATPGNYDGTGVERYPTEEEAKAALTELGITETSFGMAMEMAVRGEDFAIGLYMDGISTTVAKVGDYIYATEKGQEQYIFKDSTSTALAQVWYKELYTENLEDIILGEGGYGLTEIYNPYTLEELQSMFVSTGYSMIDGKVYYYEEFDFGEDTTVKCCFNEDELMYIGATSSEMDIYMEFYVSNSIPERMFRIECPTGYLDYTGNTDF